MELVHYQELAALDQDYWWFSVRRRYVLSQLEKYAGGRPGFLLDVGCGAGGFLHALINQHGYSASALLGIDADPIAVEVARRRGVPVQMTPGGGLTELSLPTRPDAVTMLDVLEHIAEPEDVLAALRSKVAAGAVAIVLVPALMQLWSTWDERLGHFRRYDRPTLETHLRQAGWRPLSTRYLFTGMFPAALLRRWLIVRGSVSETQFPRVSPWLNRLLAMGFYAESQIPGLPVGTSLAAVARA
jgi:SAM-dependent methyltransferase